MKSNARRKAPLWPPLLQSMKLPATPSSTLWSQIALITLCTYPLFATISAFEAVVRPTVFNDLNTNQQQLQPQLHLQSQSQSQQSAAAASKPTLPLAVSELRVASLTAAVGGSQNASGEQALQQNGAHLSLDGSASRISPLKSRFCAHQTSGHRLDLPLGLQSPLFVDDASFSASSASNEAVGAQFARLNSDAAGGAWCPLKPISASSFGKEWLQVKLNKSVVVTAIETQGRFGGKEFVPLLQIEYSRNFGRTWHKWKDYRGSSFLRANDDATSTVRNELNPPIVGANTVRVLPSSQHPRTVCLRFELLGCSYDDGAPIAYASADGVVEQHWAHLVDYTYDGVRARGMLAHGLGQLVDGVRGADNFRHNFGFEWLGWKSAQGDVALEFSFKTVRNFSEAALYSNNLFSLGVEVFQAVDVHYGIDPSLANEPLVDAIGEQQRRQQLAARRAQQTASRLAPPSAELTAALSAAATLAASGEQAVLWSPDVTSIEYEPDKRNEVARPVKVHLKQRLANKLRIVLKFASKWILVSEVEFASLPVEALAQHFAVATPETQLATAQLMATLARAKSYDEYVAILREHQLRRIAASAFIELQSPSGGSGPPFPALAQSQLQLLQQQQQQQLGPQADAPPSQQQVAADGNQRLVTGPSMRVGAPVAGWNAANGLQGDSQVSPITSPAFNPPPPLFPPNNNMYNSPEAAFAGSQFAASQEPGSDFFTSRHQQQLPPPQTTVAGSQQTASTRTALALAAAALALLVLLGALFAAANLRLKHQAHKAAHLPRHLAPPKNLMDFVGLFGQAQPGGAAGAASGTLSALVVSNAGHHINHHHMNQHHLDSSSSSAANSTPLGCASSSSNNNTVADYGSAGGLLASPYNAATYHHPSHNNSHLSHLSQHQQQHSIYSNNQLLVSLKDPSATSQSLFRRGALGKQQQQQQQSVNTQLIVGLNTANPLNYQLHATSHPLSGQHQHSQRLFGGASNAAAAYASHYSAASLSIGSSSNGNGGEYAVPDVQQMIGRQSNNCGASQHQSTATNTNNNNNNGQQHYYASAELTSANNH